MSIFAELKRRNVIRVGDHDSAIGLLEEVLRQRGLPRIDMTSQWSVFAPLRGDLRFEAVLSRVHEYVNEERVGLGLEPLSA